jgi:2'-5' RNA ligase
MSPGDYFDFPENVVARVIKNASAITFPQFELEGDRIISFSGKHVDVEKQGGCPIVLLARDGVAELTTLQHALEVAKVNAGLEWNGRSRFTPHMTLLYDERREIEQTIEPIRWTAREFVLVHSLLGQGQHVALARWQLSRSYPVRSANSPAMPRLLSQSNLEKLKQSTT